MSLEDDYKNLFQSIHNIVEAEPDQVPQLLALILSGGPFRPALEKPEILNKIVVLAKKYVAQKKNEAKSGAAKAQSGQPAAGAGKPQAMRRAGSVTGRISPQDLKRAGQITKA